MFKAFSVSKYASKKLQIAGLSVIVIFAFTVMTVLAGTATASGNITGSDTDISGSYHLTGCTHNVTGAPVNQKTHTIEVDANATYTFTATSSVTTRVYIGIYTNSYSEPNCVAAAEDSITPALTAGQTYIISIWLCNATCTGATVGDYSVAISGTGNITVDVSGGGGGSTPGSSGQSASTPVSTIVLPPDDRLNWQFGDLSAVVYIEDYGVVAYCWNGESANFALLINQDVVDSAPTEQEQSIPIVSYTKDDCSVSFYILDTGEYQININTTDNKIYEMIADNIEFSGAVLRYFDLNEQTQ